MSKHTPEPWVADHYDEGDWSIGTCEMDRTIAENAPCIPRLPTSESAANARRIVACVNACAGMDDPAAGIARLKAREAEMREAIVGSLITLRSSMGNTNKVMYTEAKLSRALLAHEAPKDGSVIDMALKKRDDQWKAWIIAKGFDLEPLESGKEHQ
jgi:hypothetical protein